MFSPDGEIGPSFRGGSSTRRGAGYHLAGSSLAVVHATVVWLQLNGSLNLAGYGHLAELEEGQAGTEDSHSTDTRHSPRHDL